MSLDSERERRSSVAISAYFIGSSVLPDGSIEKADRQTSGYGYSGIVPVGEGLDSECKRRSSVAINAYFLGPSVIPDGLISQVDRQTIGYGYCGILVVGGGGVTPGIGCDDLTLISTQGWFGDGNGLAAVALYGWYCEGVEIGGGLFIPRDSLFGDMFN